MLQVILPFGKLFWDKGISSLKWTRYHIITRWQKFGKIPV